MIKLPVRTLFKIISFSLAVVLLSACASNPGKNQPIEVRVMSMWDSLLASDVSSAYEYLSPGYRSSVSLSQYQKQLLIRKVKWTSAKYIESECTETTCNVKISLGYTVFAAVPGVKTFSSAQTITEDWVQIDRVWYMVPER
jgi:hypothetical protein